MSREIPISPHSSSRHGSSHSRGLLVATTAFTPAVWGTTYLVATELLPSGRPVLAAVVRALPVGLAFVLWSRRLPHGEWWWKTAVLGFLNIGAFFALLFIAAFRLPGGVAATTGAVQPLIATGIAVVLLGEAFTRRVVIAAVAGVLGVALLVLQPQAALDPIGLLAAFAGTVSMAAGIVLTKHWGRPVDLIAFTGWQLTAGGLMLVPVMVVAEGLPQQFTLEHAAGFMWLAIIGTGLAYALWFRGIRALPVATTSFLVLLSPLVATILGWIVLNENLTPRQLTGMVLVAGAVVAPQIKSRGTSSLPTPVSRSTRLRLASAGRSITRATDTRVQRFRATEDATNT